MSGKGDTASKMELRTSDRWSLSSQYSPTSHKHPPNTRALETSGNDSANLPKIGPRSFVWCATSSRINIRTSVAVPLSSSDKKSTKIKITDSACCGKRAIQACRALITKRRYSVLPSEALACDSIVLTISFFSRLTTSTEFFSVTKGPRQMSNTFRLTAIEGDDKARMMSITCCSRMALCAARISNRRSRTMSLTLLSAC
mmetsp:Transcript_17753/g.42681  ORF Transcript_17753/g.42681 Transcript_17753/m.42681 type:complete len:200 (-) Transcript_17753:162-761(-)